jgi:glucose dehydrogenase
VLVDGNVDGQPRKLVVQASRNGYFFVLDRATGKRIVSAPFIDTVNWAKGINANGQPIPDPKKFPTTDGVLVSPSSNGATNWQAPSYSPRTGLFYVGSSRSFSMFYLIDTDDHPEGWGGLDSGVGSEGNALLAIDYHTAKVVWRHEWPSGNGIVNNLSTAGNVLFTSNGQNVVAFDAANGKILWHAGLMAAPSAGPITYMLDGKQYVLVAAGDSLYAFTVNRAEE